MKVICIDAGYKKNSRRNGGCANELTEGAIYTVIKIFPAHIDVDNYLLDEVKSDGYLQSFLSTRFIPLSEIDEMEMEIKINLPNTINN